MLEEYRKHGRIVDGGTVEAAQRAAARAWLADTVAGKRSVLVVDTNEQAADVSAQLRAELVRLGRVAEAGVPLAGGAVAGVGDLVQARRNAWDLAGYEGNARGPVNRETYRVTAVRPDGSLRAERLDGGPPITLPAAYVAEHLALGYASTVHSAQGRTVDTAHAVVTPRTGAASLYVGLSRGRQANTAYVSTVQVPEDSPPGQASTVERRDPAAVLADVLDRDDDSAAALRIEEDSATLARSARTAGDRMADAASLLSPGRIASVLDRLAVDGTLTADQRHRLAADPATSQLGTLLRQAELAGRDGEAALAAAVTDRPLDGAESIAAVLHSRLAARLGPLVPSGDRFTDRIPAVPDPTWRRYLERLAENADRRARELGTRTAEELPRWAREALGPVPARPVERLDWEERAGRVAAYREMAGHDDQAVALGAAPPPGKVEHHAAWHSAWRALGRPESGREEAGMSDGSLLLRVRAYRREEAWAPAYVADELDGTAREAARRRQDAVLFAARADTAPEADRDALRRTAAEAAAYADVLDQRVRDLTEADHVRAGWYVHTAETRAAADRARAELADRGIDPDAPADARHGAGLARRARRPRPGRGHLPADHLRSRPRRHTRRDRPRQRASHRHRRDRDPGHPRHRHSRTGRRRCRRGPRPRRHRRADRRRGRAGPAGAARAAGPSGRRRTRRRRGPPDRGGAPGRRARTRRGGGRGAGRVIRQTGASTRPLCCTYGSKSFTLRVASGKLVDHAHRRCPGVVDRPRMSPPLRRAGHQTPRRRHVEVVRKDDDVPQPVGDPRPPPQTPVGRRRALHQLAHRHERHAPGPAVQAGGVHIELTSHGQRDDVGVEDDRALDLSQGQPGGTPAGRP